MLDAAGGEVDVIRLGSVIAAMLITLGLAACQASGPPLPDPPLPTGHPPGHWQLKFDDEFDGQSLNTANWSKGWLAPGITPPVNPEELQCYNPADVNVSDGALALSLTQQSESCGRPDRPYGSGLVNTDGKFEFTYGFMEARIWVPAQGQQIANWPAFWADGQNWPQDGEIDVVEGLRGEACWHFHYTGGNPGGCARGTFASGWHTYAADWEPNFITYYYDGRVVGAVRSGTTSAPMYLILNYATAHAHSGPVKVPATMRVDYVRVWQHTG
jgi:beta-glucanase (GH16 family)